MKTLKLDHFINAAYDFEMARYQVLGVLQGVQEAFSSNYIYPYLGDLVETYRSLKAIMERTEDLHESFPKEIEGIDLENKEIIYSLPELGNEKVEDVRHLIEWALPHIQTTIEEGKTIYEFVEDSVKVEEVGLIPTYTEEGYVLVPNREEETLNILRYKSSIITGSDERYRSLKTVVVKQMELNDTLPPQQIKLDLVEENPKLPNPATFFLDTELTMPFEQTIFPIAKRKLMRHLAQDE